MSNERQYDQLERARGLILGISANLVTDNRDPKMVKVLDEAVGLIEDVQGRSAGEMEFMATSIVSMQTGEGLVDIKLGATRVQLDPQKTREIAAYLFQAAEASDFDAALRGMLTEDWGLDIMQAAEFLQRLRNYRAGVETPK